MSTLKVQKVEKAIEQLRSSILGVPSRNSSQQCDISISITKYNQILQQKQKQKKAKKQVSIEDGLKVFRLNTRFLKIQLAYVALLCSYFTLLFTYYEIDLKERNFQSDWKEKTEEEVMGQYQTELENWNGIAGLLLWAVFGVSIGLAACGVLRYLSRKQLAYQRRQKYFSFNSIIIQSFLMLIQPYAFLSSFSLPSTIQSSSLSGSSLSFPSLPLNHLLLILSLLRSIPFVLRSLLSLSPYSTPRQYRISKIYNADNTLLFQIRAIFHQHPVLTISVLYFGCVVGFAYCYRVLEGEGLRTGEYQMGVVNGAKGHYEGQGLDNLWNCVWMAMLTMTTVGFGDTVPKSVYGGYVTMLGSYVGVIGTSLFVLSITENLELNYREERALIILKRFSIRKQQKQKSAKFLQLALSHLFLSYKHKIRYAPSPQQRQLKRELHKIRLFSKNGPKQSSLFQQVMQQQFQIIRSHIECILENCQDIIKLCAGKRQVIEGVMGGMGIGGVGNGEGIGQEMDIGQGEKVMEEFLKILGGKMGKFCGGVGNVTSLQRFSCNI